MTRDEDGGNALKLACGELEPTRIFTVREIFANELCRGTRSREKKKSPATRLSHCHWDWQCVCGAATAACAVWARADAYIYIKDKVNDWRGPTGWHQVLRGGSPGAPPQTLINCPKARSRLPAPRTLSMAGSGVARATTSSSHRPLLAGGVEKVFICTGGELGGASGSAWPSASTSPPSLSGTAS